ncbi:MAG: high-potential iron-sulfur protein [Rhizobiaceae bacterium]
MESGLTRRQILQAALALSPIAVAGCAATPTTDRPALTANDPVARALAYYPNTSDVPANQPLAANHDVSQRCADCLHRRGSAGEGMLRCPTFPGRAVSEDGWCSLWTKG